MTITNREQAKNLLTLMCCNDHTHYVYTLWGNVILVGTQVIPVGFKPTTFRTFSFPISDTKKRVQTYLLCLYSFGKCDSSGNTSDSGGIQTHDLQNRNLTLYSAKLRNHHVFAVQNYKNCRDFASFFSTFLFLWHRLPSRTRAIRAFSRHGKPQAPCTIFALFAL